MTPKTVTIPAKMSGTGTIHDTASQHTDRTIVFSDGAQYAVVLAAYYGHGNGIHYLAQDAEEALKISAEQSEYSHVIIDSDGDIVEDAGKYYPTLRKI